MDTIATRTARQPARRLSASIALAAAMWLVYGNSGLLPSNLFASDLFGSSHGKSCGPHCAKHHYFWQQKPHPYGRHSDAAACGTCLSCPPQGPFFGYYPTCWHRFPQGWQNCPVSAWEDRYHVAPGDFMTLPLPPETAVEPPLEVAPPAPQPPVPGEQAPKARHESSRRPGEASYYRASVGGAATHTAQAANKTLLQPNPAVVRTPPVVAAPAPAVVAAVEPSAAPPVSEPVTVPLAPLFGRPPARSAPSYQPVSAEEKVQAAATVQKLDKLPIRLDSLPVQAAATAPVATAGKPQLAERPSKAAASVVRVPEVKAELEAAVQADVATPQAPTPAESTESAAAVEAEPEVDSPVSYRLNPFRDYETRRQAEGSDKNPLRAVQPK